MLNWITEIELFSYLNCILMQNWIVWNRTVIDIETLLMLKSIFWIRTLWLNWIAWNRNVFGCQTELFEIELIICIKLI